MFRLSVVAALLLAAAPVRAGTVYRCVEKGKPVSFQSEPCDEKARATRAVGYVPDAEPSPASRRAATQSEMDRRYARARAATAHVVEATRPNADGVTCWQARNERDEWERHYPLARNVDTLRHWQEYVHQHCR